MRKRKVNWDKVIKLYPENSTKKVEEKTGIKWSTIRTIAARAKLKKVNRYWTKKEEKLVLKYYSYGITFVSEKLPERSKWSIINNYRELSGLR